MTDPALVDAINNIAKAINNLAAAYRGERPPTADIQNPVCPRCGKEALTKETQYGLRSDCEPCGLWSWKGKPLVDAETHLRRREAHQAFDALWKNYGLDRHDAYNHLAEELGVPEKEAHIASMDKDTAGRVPEAAKRIKTKLDLQDIRDEGIPF